MSETPLSPQTDYPYAARNPAETGPGEATPPKSPIDRWIQYVNTLLDWHPDLDWPPADKRTTVASPRNPLLPTFAVTILIFAVANITPLLIIAFTDRPSADWVVSLIYAPFGGIMAGQFFVFSYGLVWSPGSFLRRLILHWLLALTLYACWASTHLIVGRFDGWGDDALETSSEVLMLLPAIGLAIQSLLWVLSIYGGWRLEISSLPQKLAPPKAKIGDLLFGTAIVAISLTILRLMLRDPSRINDMFWISCGIGFLALAIVSYLIVAPLLRLILGIESKMRSALGVCFFWALLNALILPGFIYFNPGWWLEITLLSSLMSLTGLLTISLPLVLLRAAGYRLRIGK